MCAYNDIVTCLIPGHDCASLCFQPCQLSTLCKSSGLQILRPAASPGVINEGGNETGLVSDPGKAPCGRPDLLVPAMPLITTLCQFCHYILWQFSILITVNPSQFTINLTGKLSSNAITQYPEMPTYNTQYIYFVYYNSIRKPVKDF